METLYTVLVIWFAIGINGFSPLPVAPRRADTPEIVGKQAVTQRPIGLRMAKRAIPAEIKGP